MKSESETHPSKFDQILGELLVAAETGDSSSLETICSRFPDYAHKIRQFFELNDRVFGAGQTFLCRPKVEGYKILDELGRGGMGSVHRAIQISTGRTVAIKFIKSDYLARASDGENSLRRFKQEVMLATRLNHENVVQIHEVQLSDPPYFTMQLIDGPSLAILIKQKPLDAFRAAKLVQQCALAIAAAHEKNILHRDIKPQNILLNAKQDKAYVSDFGLAKLNGDNVLETAADQLIGTPAYMSPEQAVSSRQVHKRSDIYSLGATLYHSITGRAPFHASTYAETIRQIHHESIVPPKNLNAHVPIDLNSICLKCLELDPNSRYGSAIELADDLDNFLNDRPTIARPISRFEKLRKWSRRNPIQGILALATLSSLVGLFATLILFSVLVSGKNQELLDLAQAESTARKTAEAAKQDTFDAFQPLFLGIDQENTFILDLMNNQEHCRAILKQTVSNYQQMQENEPDNANLRFREAKALARLGEINLVLGHYQNCVDAIESANRLFNVEFPIFVESPEQASASLVTANERYIASCFRNLAIAYEYLDSDELAENSHRESIRRIEECVAKISKTNGSYIHSMLTRSVNHREYGRFLLQLGQIEDAKQEILYAIDLARLARDEHRAVFPLSKDLRFSTADLVLSQIYFSKLKMVTQCTTSQEDEAASFVDRLQALLDTWESETAGYFSGMLEEKTKFAYCLAEFSRFKLTFEIGDKQQCLNDLEKACSILEKLSSQNPAIPKYQTWFDYSKSIRKLAAQGELDIKELPAVDLKGVF